MSNVLTVEQREQAGSDSYNRFEYQVHWIVCHIIDKLQEDAECIVFCEFHDDMAECKFRLIWVLPQISVNLTSPVH